MSYIYHLAGDDIELAMAELKGFLESQEIEEEPERKRRLGLSEAKPSQLKRLGLVHHVSRFLNESEELETDYRPKNSFAVNTYDFTGEKNTEGLKDELGELLKTPNNTVDLENPDEVINVYIMDDSYVLGRQIQEIDRNLFKQRKNQNRPFSAPISLDPVLARVMVNLSEISAGGKILDPFCGTGGILIEAGLCGILPCGSDVQEEMVEGARKNLEEYGILNHRIREAGIKETEEKFSDKKFDGVVTDLPYGKASRSEGSPVEKFLEVAPELTDGKIVFMYDKPEIAGYESDFEIYVHRSLTRYIYRL